jgi:hypothetical protein
LLLLLGLLSSLESRVISVVRVIRFYLEATSSLGFVIELIEMIVPLSHPFVYH